jgi:cathepsin B
MKYISANFQIIIFINFFILILSNDETEIIPEFFDCRIKWPKCIPKISDQGSCGACYAMSVSTAFSTRYCIRNELSEVLNFSPQNLINCLSGCKGEFPDVAWDYISNNGITTGNCLLYKGYSNTCNMKCDSNENKFNKYFSGKTKFLESEIEIKKEILRNGPVTSMMNLYNDYFNYKSGIYMHNKKNNKVLGYHSITLMGWGIEDNVKYWLVQDSYGLNKGENGFIKIKIGDDCGAGATAFCDEKVGKYNEYSEDNSNGNQNSTIVKKELKSNNISFDKKYLNLIIILALFL